VKLLVLNPSAQIEGPENFMLGVIQGTPGAGFDWVTAVLPEGGPLLEKLQAIGVRTVVSRWPRFIFKLKHNREEIFPLLVILFFPVFIPWLLRVRWEMRKSTVVYSNGFECDLLSVLLKLTTTRPFVWFVHAFIRNHLLLFFYDLLASLVPKLLLVNSRSTGSMFVFSKKKARLLYNGVNLDQFRPMEQDLAFRRSLNIPDDHKIVGMVSVMEPWKGMDVFLKASSVIARHRKKVTFLIVGREDPGVKARLEQMATEGGMRDRVVFTGFVDDVVKAYALLDIFVHASKEPEPFGRVVLEAMACGKPVIATGGGGVLETVENGKSGLLVPMGDIAALALAIDGLLNEGDLREGLGAGAMERAQHFDELKSAERFRRLLEEASARKIQPTKHPAA
jgi:glycosyltransferase involved in cell wall biosynthesis